MKLALVQLRRDERPEYNLERIKQLMPRAREADLILLPENWLGPLPVLAEQYFSYLREIANLLPRRALLVGGAQYVRIGRRIYSRGAVIQPGLPPFASYSKIFPSQAVGERARLTPGKHLSIVEHAGWKIGVLVCVDLFYPELARYLALLGCSLIINPASIPADRQFLWQSLGLVRASENTVFVAGINSTGGVYPDGRRIAGGSFVALPHGYFGGITGPEETVLLVELEKGLIEETRKRWPYLLDIRGKRYYCIVLGSRWRKL
ncbi:MAG: carbon-nitrogen hydrolase family protein [Thermanaeromonas sp.]|uniref:carbon-nitrogen hydrolase family protein n=1 Tax=Thermanaeromonas sp. TaxID=2003697 RepID=UPI00243D3067|nr:carbon-nitrogen hydrolase family protein [Thermanaeromonas sp.]MCG0278999.1 carbon-nitrogen hydrolase family protein [Thermanaeromonas sp.]